MWAILAEKLLDIVGKVIPDPQARAAAQLEILKLRDSAAARELQAQLQIALGQIEVNKAEAAAPGLFKGGWRPGTGWVCLAGLAYQFLLAPLLPWLLTVAGARVPPLPPLDIETLLALLVPLLGLGAYRTAEKLKGAA